MIETFRPMNFNLIFPDDHPALAGHFPGHPMVPAALLLDEARAALENEIQQNFFSAKKVRFIAPIVPGTLIKVECAESIATNYSFSCKLGNEIVAKGVLSKILDKQTITATPTFDPSSPLDAKMLYERLPHSLGMRLIDQVLSHSSSDIYCQTNSPQDNPLKRKQNVPSWATLEYAAQAFALLGLLNHNKNNTNNVLRKAFIVNVKYMSCMTQVLQDIKKPLQVRARVLASQPQAANCEFIINSNQETVSQGQFTVVYI